jgi:uncharacterized membrane protein YdcZ (DUF606 family)
MPFLVSSAYGSTGITVPSLNQLIKDLNKSELSAPFYSYMTFYVITMVINVITLSAKLYHNFVKLEKDFSLFFVAGCVASMAPVLSAAFLIRNVFYCNCFSLTISAIGSSFYLLLTAMILSFFAAVAESMSQSEDPESDSKV